MTTKKRHALEEASLKWAKPLIEQAQLTPTQEGSVEKKEPHMLHVVYRIKTVRGRPWWEKELIEKLHLDGRVIIGRLCGLLRMFVIRNFFYLEEEKLLGFL